MQLIVQIQAHQHLSSLMEFTLWHSASTSHLQAEVLSLQSTEVVSLKKARNIFGFFNGKYFFCSHKLNGQWQNFVQFSLPHNPKFQFKLSRPCLSTPKYSQSALFLYLLSIVTTLSHKTSHVPAFNNSLVLICFKKIYQENKIETSKGFSFSFCLTWGALR